MRTIFFLWMRILNTVANRLMYPGDSLMSVQLSKVGYFLDPDSMDNIRELIRWYIDDANKAQKGDCLIALRKAELYCESQYHQCMKEEK